MRVEGAPVASFAALFGDPTRMTMCLALIDGRAWTAGELARHAGVSPQTATAHLTSLVTAGVLAEDRQGRHRYLRLAGPETALLIEDLASAARVTLPSPTSLRSRRVAEGLSFARTCYDHLAGRLGVALMDTLVTRGLLSVAAGQSLTPEGVAWVHEFAPETTLDGVRRPVVRPCLDWTERRLHLGGVVGAVLCTGFAARGWTRQGDRERAVRVTATGERGIADLLGLDVARLRTAP